MSSSVAPGLWIRETRGENDDGFGAAAASSAGIMNRKNSAVFRLKDATLCRKVRGMIPAPNLAEMERTE